MKKKPKPKEKEENLEEELEDKKLPEQDEDGIEIIP